MTNKSFIHDKGVLLLRFYPEKNNVNIINNDVFTFYQESMKIKRKPPLIYLKIIINNYIKE